MKQLHLDLNMGAAGDMLAAALFELTDNPAETLNELNDFGIPSVTYKAEASFKCGIKGTHIKVEIDGHTETEDALSHHHHHHGSRGPGEIREIVNGLNISDEVKNDVNNVYELIANAESEVHGVPVSEIHFHEIGTMDAVADITAVCYLMRKIRPDRITASPVNTGSGQVKTAHGIIPVPAPATMNLLKGIPAYSGSIKSELCTPTGAALIKYFADEFCEMPPIAAERIGYGMGTKDFDCANCVRAVLGEKEGGTDTVIELSCNIDDITPEEIGFAAEQCFRQGAKDVFSVPAVMKKGRPGTLFCVICKEEEKAELIKTIFRYTSTIGIRENMYNRYILDRRTEMVYTEYGEIRKKISEGYGVKREKYEYDDLAAISEKTGLSIEEIKNKLK